MEDVDVHKLSRKELMQLCSDHNIRTAGVKHDDLVRLLQEKLHPPASDPPRVPKLARRLMSSNNNTQISSKGKGIKSAEKPLTPVSGSSQGRSKRSSAIVDDTMRKDSPQPSPRKDQVSPKPGGLPRKAITAKPNSTPGVQRASDLLRKKVNTLSAIGKLQLPVDRARPQPSDGSATRSRNSVAAATTSAISKQVQDQRRSSPQSRSSSTPGVTPRKNMRSTSMGPVRRPGERPPPVKKKDSTTPGKAQASNSKAENNSPRTASERDDDASVTAIAGSRAGSSDQGSHSFDSVAGHHVCLEAMSDAGDGHSVTSRGLSPLWDSKNGGNDSLESSLWLNLVGDAHGVEINSFLDGHSADPEVLHIAAEAHEQAELEQGRDCSAPEASMVRCQENETIADSAEESCKGELAEFEKDELGFIPEINISQLDELPALSYSDEGRTTELDSTFLETATSVFYEDSSAPASNCEQLVNRPTPAVESDAPVAVCEHDDAATSTTPLGKDQKESELPISLAEVKDIISSSNHSLDTTFGADETERQATSEENDDGGKLINSTPNFHNEDSPEEPSAISHASTGSNVLLVIDQYISPISTYSSSQQEPTITDTLPKTTENPSCTTRNNTTMSTPTAERIERHYEEPLPSQTDKDSASISPTSVFNLPNSSPTADDIPAMKTRDGQRPRNFAPEQDHILKDGSEKENGMQMKRASAAFPSPIMLWCSQLFSSIFGSSNRQSNSRS